MLWVPKKGRLSVQYSLGDVGNSAPGIAVTTGASASTKGTPAELISSTNFDAYWISITAWLYGLSATACQGSMDILLGAATERVLVSDLLMGYCGGDTAANISGPKVWHFPIYIPSGTRIAAQAAGARTSSAVRVGVTLYGGDGYPPFRVGQKITTYGMGTVPNGTSITPGVSGAEGSWTQITASTAEDHFAFFPSYQVSGDTTTNNRHMQVDIGVGSATEEQIGEPFWFLTSALEQMSGPIQCFPVFADVPASTRLVMRASMGSTADGAYNGVIHAVS